MKALVKDVYIGDEHFVLITGKRMDGETYYGTIPHHNLDESGALICGMNGLEMCIERTVIGAIEARERDLAYRDWRDEHPDATEDEQLKFLMFLFRVKED